MSFSNKEPLNVHYFINVIVDAQVNNVIVKIVETGLWQEKQERKDKGKKRVEEISQDERKKIREEERRKIMKEM